MTRLIAASEFTQGDAAVDNCWKRIGIHGDRSCPQLAQHGHCRDCPTFRLAAAALLDRDLPENAAPVRAPASLADPLTESATIFRIATEWFALPTMVLDEIVGARKVHSLPHKRNPALLGLINVRGELVICVSLASLLIGGSASAAEGRLIVMRHPGGRLACPVDEVQHTHRYAPDHLEPVPATVGRSTSSFTRGLMSCEGRTIACLDPKALFDALGRSLG